MVALDVVDPCSSTPYTRMSYTKTDYKLRGEVGGRTPADLHLPFHGFVRCPVLHRELHHCQAGLRQTSPRLDYFKLFPIPFFHTITALKLVCRWFCFWLALACAFVFVAIFQGDLAHGQQIQHDITTNYRGDYFTFQLIQNILCFASGLINALCIFDMGMTVSHQSGNTSHTGRLIMIPGVAQRLIC